MSTTALSRLQDGGNNANFLLNQAAVLGVIMCSFTYYYATKRSNNKGGKDEAEVSVTLPTWAKSYFLEKQEQEYENATDEDMAKVAIELSSKNVAEGTGGPFGCAIFERDQQSQKIKLFSVGVNRVVPLGNSTLHAEMVAIQFAQRKLNTFSMANNNENDDDKEKAISNKKEYILCTSCEPCAMCLGGILWSGVSEVICCAAKDDAEAIGFDEGPVFEESYGHLQKAGIVVKKRVLREKGAQVLQDYAKQGVIYNGS